MSDKCTSLNSTVWSSASTILFASTVKSQVFPLWGPPFMISIFRIYTPCKADVSNWSEQSISPPQGAINPPLQALIAAADGHCTIKFCMAPSRSHAKSLRSCEILWNVRKMYALESPHSAKLPSMKIGTSLPSQVRPMMERSAVPTMKSTWVMESLRPRSFSSSLVIFSPPLTHSG